MTTGSGAARSRLWVAWIILGVVVLSVVVGLMLLVPMLTTALSGDADHPAAAASKTPRPATTPTATAVEVVPSTPDEAAAVEAVQQYSTALNGADCEAYFAATTEAHRAGYGITDCETFADVSRNLTSSVDDYTVVVRDVETRGEWIEVSVTETFSSSYDANGDELDSPVDYLNLYEYVVVSSNDAWVVETTYLEPEDQNVASKADELAAEDAVVMYIGAMSENECDEYVASTDKNFRTTLGATDCETFSVMSGQSPMSTEEYNVYVTDIAGTVDEIAVLTTATYTTAAGQTHEENWEYSLVPSGSMWVIHEAVLTG